MKTILASLIFLASAVSAQTVNLPVPNVTGHACSALQGAVTVVGFDTNRNIQATFTEVAILWLRTARFLSGGNTLGINTFFDDSTGELR
jgi:hypothetical protein